MERAWSTRTHQHVKEACENGSAMIEKLSKLSGKCGWPSDRGRRQWRHPAGDARAHRRLNFPRLSLPRTAFSSPSCILSKTCNTAYQPASLVKLPACYDFLAPAAQVYSVAHAFPTYAGHVPLTGGLQPPAPPCAAHALACRAWCSYVRHGLPRPPAAEYGTQEGVPNKLYFVPHAKARASLPPLADRLAGLAGWMLLGCCACTADSSVPPAVRACSPPPPGPLAHIPEATGLPSPACTPTKPTEPLLHVPPPPPLLQALIFYRSVKAGILLGLEQGQGFVIARWAGAALWLPGGARCAVAGEIGF